MFSWFTGDTSWECNSAWRPVGGFKSWDGSGGFGSQFS